MRRLTHLKKRYITYYCLLATGRGGGKLTHRDFKSNEQKFIVIRHNRRRKHQFILLMTDGVIAVRRKSVFLSRIHFILLWTEGRDDGKDSVSLGAINNSNLAHDRDFKQMMIKSL